jgi:hypothetical protein
MVGHSSSEGNSPLRIEYQYFTGCPSHERALERLRKVLVDCGVEADIEVVKVETSQQATELGFIGSPTILVDGKDIDPMGRNGLPVGLACRIYIDEDGCVSPLPSENLVRLAVCK